MIKIINKTITVIANAMKQSHKLKDYFIRASLAMTIMMLFTACEEEPPFIDMNPPKVVFDTAYIDNNLPTPQQKTVLLEDISGVKCPNCPAATKIALSTKAELNGRLNIVVIHPKISALSVLVDPVTSPYKSTQDFRTEAGKTICNDIVGVPNALPRGCIDRVHFNDQSGIVIDRTVWNTKIKERDELTSPVNIEIEQIASTADKIIIEVTLHYTQTQTDSNYLSVMLLEDGMVDVQEYDTIIDGVQSQRYKSDYTHNHVLRDMFTLYTGDILNKADVSLVAGRVIKKRYVYNIPAPDYAQQFPVIIRKQNTKALAFVHRNGANNKEVLQSYEIELD